MIKFFQNIINWYKSKLPRKTRLSLDLSDEVMGSSNNNNDDDFDNKIRILEEGQSGETPNLKAVKQLDELFSSNKPDALHKAYMNIKKHPYFKKIIKHNLENLFISKGCKQVEVSESSANEKGVNIHFIILADNKRFHAKTPALPSSNSSVLNEVFVYNLLSNLGYGPKELSAMIIGNETLGSSNDSSRIMIITEDLGNFMTESERSRLIKNNWNSKSDSWEPTIDPNVKIAPVRDKDNIHRCCIHTIINLLNLSDVQSNHGNMGIRYTYGPGDLRKEKPFIFDFLLGAGAEYTVPKLMKDFARQENIIDNSYFSYQTSPKVKQEAFFKLFIQGKNGLDFIEAIEVSANQITDRFKKLVPAKDMECVDQLKKHLLLRCTDYADLAIRHILSNPAIDIDDQRDLISQKQENFSSIRRNQSNPSSSFSNAGLEEVSPIIAHDGLTCLHR